MTRCAQPGCTGTIQDGFCDVCGLAPAGTDPAAAGTARTSAPTARGTERATGRGTGRGTGRTSRGSTRSTRTGRTGSARSARGRLGAGLVEVPPVPYRDPSTAIMANPEVVE